MPLLSGASSARSNGANPLVLCPVVGFSTLITRAPKSANTLAQDAVAIDPERSITVYSESGYVMTISLQMIAMDDEINESTAAYLNSDPDGQTMLRVKINNPLKTIEPSARAS